MVALRSHASLEMAAAKEAVARRMIDALERADLTAIGELVSDDVVPSPRKRSSRSG